MRIGPVNVWQTLFPRLALTLLTAPARLYQSPALAPRGVLWPLLQRRARRRLSLHAARYAHDNDYGQQKHDIGQVSHYVKLAIDYVDFIVQSHFVCVPHNVKYQMSMTTVNFMKNI